MTLASPRVTRVKPEADFRLKIWFTNGEVRLFDLTPYLHIGVFRALKDPAAFGSVRVSLGSVRWSGGQDLSPDTLYLESAPVSVKMGVREPTKKYRVRDTRGSTSAAHRKKRLE